MADENKRLDESLSIDALRKSLTGQANTKPAFDRITVDANGQVEVKPTAIPAAPANTAAGAKNGSQSSD
jgi:hypothetical protein